MRPHARSLAPPEKRLRSAGGPLKPGFGLSGRFDSRFGTARWPTLDDFSTAPITKLRLAHPSHFSRASASDHPCGFQTVAVRVFVADAPDGSEGAGKEKFLDRHTKNLLSR